MNINIITDIKNVLSKEDFEEFDKTFWEHPEETIKSIKEQYKEILFIHENTPGTCNLYGEDYETPSGVVVVVSTDNILSTRRFKEGKTVFFPGKIEDISFDEHPSGFCELRFIVDNESNKGLELLVTEYDDGVPGEFHYREFPYDEIPGEF